MSLKSWKAEFYPVPAHHVAKKNAIAHSLRKWEGLLPENLKRHGCGASYEGIYDLQKQGVIFPIEEKTSALCRRFLPMYPDPCSDVPRCAQCPLYLVRGAPCYEQRKGEYYSPHGRWLADANPIPMIKWLKKARAFQTGPKRERADT